MFEYTFPDGTALPENEVTKLAVQNGLTTDEYAKKKGLKLRPKQKAIAKERKVAVVKKEVAPKAVEEVEVIKPKAIKKEVPVAKELDVKPELDILGIKKMASLPAAKSQAKPIKKEEELVSIEDFNKAQEDIEQASKIKNNDFLSSLKAGLDSGLLRASQGIQDLPINTLEWVKALSDPILNAAGAKEFAIDDIVKTFKLENPNADALSKQIKKADAIIQDYNSKNGGDAVTAIQNGNYFGASKMIAGSTVQSLPLMAAALLGGGATGATGIIAGLTTSMKQTQLREEEPEMPLALRTTNAGVTGLLEAYLGQLYTGASGAAVKSILAKTGVKEGAKTLSKGIVNTLATAIEKNPFVGLIGEVAEESSVEFGEQLVDMASGIRTELDLKAITNAGISSLGMGTTNTVAVYGAKGYMKASEYNQVKKVNKEIDNLSRQIANPLTPNDNKSILAARIDRLVSENKKLVGSSLEKIDALPSNVKAELNDINTTIEDLQTKFSAIAEDINIDPKTKQALAEELKLNAKALNNRKAKIIEGNYAQEDFNSLNEDKQIAYKEEAIAELEKESPSKDGIANAFKDEDIKAKAVDLYIREARSIAIDKDIENVKIGAKELGLEDQIEVPDFENETDIINYLGENTDLSLDEIKNYSKSYGIFVPLANGKEALIINKKLVKEEGVVTTGAHEFLHKLIYKAVKNDPQLQKKVGSSLYKHIESYLGTGNLNNTEFNKRYTIYKNEFDNQKTVLNSKIEKANQYLKNGQISEDQHAKTIALAEQASAKLEGKYLEEVLPLLSESLSKGDIKYNETFFTKMGDIIRRVFQKFGLSKVSFETGKDVFDFVRDYNKSFEKGKYTKAFGKLALEGEFKGKKQKIEPISKSNIDEIKQSKANVSSLEKELIDLEEEYDEGYGDLEETAYNNRKANIERKIQLENKKIEAGITPVAEVKKEDTEEYIVKEIIKSERGSISSDKVQQIYDKKGKNGAAEIIQLFKPITKKIVDKRRDAPGFDRELLTDEIETGVGGLLDLITKYKPESGVPLAAYINKYLPMRAIATSKRILDIQFNKNAEEEVGLMATETADQNMTEYVAEKPKYKNALESKVFEAEELKTINNKLLTVVRTLKTKINEPITLNRTVTPLISEIRDEVGKQIDIDVKTAMGGKKNGQLKNWMIKNKKYILENMTTTWLMGANGQGGFPQAIQKQIDGRFVNYPEWVGKKIDREKVTTDLAGRTSGAELVRRLPNVNNNVSLEDYLGQVIGPDGNPIRGRKESLAKAIAEEASFDIINDDLANEGPIYDALSTNQQRLGVELIDNLTTEILRQSERGNVKFSLPADKTAPTIKRLIEVASIYGINSDQYNKVLNSLSKADKKALEKITILDNIAAVTTIQENQEGIIGKRLDKSGIRLLSKDFKEILETNVGVKVSDEFSDIVAKRQGAGIGKYRFFVPPSAADFELLLYDFLGRGKVGEEQYNFFNKTLLEPYSEGIALINAAKQAIKNDYKLLVKRFPEVNKKLGKLLPSKDFTYDQALRVSIWNAAGTEIPGLSDSDIKKLVDFVNADADLLAFRDGLIATGRQGAGWVAPSEYWDSETLISDLHNITEKLGRQKYLEDFANNSKEIFSKENLNKIETIYGSNFRESLEDILYRMINGTNREAGQSRINAAWMNWINNSTAAIMFLNTKSALLQTIGSINYLNWRDNNPINAAKAFANQPQYWKDFAKIYNSDKIKERRSGLKDDVSSAEIANAAEGSKNKVGAVISYLLKKGFSPTQIADSFAIAAGGAPFYRNRINYNMSKGMDLKEAEDQAWKDFSKVTDETQQSGDPRDISQQQASVAGRLVLAFQNTPMQQARLIKKSALDLINGRGDAKTHISKIVYYTAIQNIIFGALQSALFTVIFDDEEEDKKKKNAQNKWIDIANGTVDTLLRGSGLGGAIVATIKNIAKTYLEEKEKGFKADFGKVLIEAANIAPPLGSKFQKGFGAMRTNEFEKDVIAKRGFSLIEDGRLNVSPSYMVLGQTVEAATNLPLNRLVTKVDNVAEALDSRNQSWQRIALLLGYKPYAVGARNEEADIIKEAGKATRKEEGKIKAAETRQAKKEAFDKLPFREQQRIKSEKRRKRREEKRLKRNIYK